MGLTRMPQPTEHMEAQGEALKNEPVNPQVQEQKKEVRDSLNSTEHGLQVDELKDKGMEELNTMIDKLAFSKNPSDVILKKQVLQALFELRGATRPEAGQQLMLSDKYNIQSVVTPNGELSMWPASTTPETVKKVLEENTNLEPKIQAYLNKYLEDPATYPNGKLSFEK